MQDAPCKISTEMYFRARFSSSEIFSGSFAARAPNHTKVPFCVDFIGRMAGMDAPSGGASGFLSRPEGRVVALHPPGKGRYAPGENSDNR